ncbi:MAG: cereblon family protein [Desulfopila sp.]|jgi:hypothetical protein|nr:cereblon family protein [Desulfopila sp.]
MAEVCLLKEEGGTSSKIDIADRAEENEEAERGLLCGFCSHLITYPKYSIAINGEHHHTFFNPAGIVYEIGCFSSAEGCSLHGPPTGDFTWFAGYVWRLALCASCFAHLGWSFGSDGGMFYGLIRKNLAG